jgi:hypothetical protein
MKWAMVADAAMDFSIVSRPRTDRTQLRAARASFACFRFSMELVDLRAVLGNAQVLTSASA